MDIPLAENDWQSTSENIPRIKLHNLYIAEDPASPSGKTRVSRPTLDLAVSGLAGKTFGAWELDGALGSTTAAFIVSGTTLYRFNGTAAASIGSIPGSGYCQFAGTKDRALILRDGIVYSTTGGAITTVTMPDADLVGSIATINGYFLLTVAGSNRFYWITPGGTDPDPLDFASAERYPDPLVAVRISNDEIWLIGTKGPEVWQSTGDSDAPFERIPARDYDEGCASAVSAIPVTYQSLPALMWVTPQGAVTLAQGKTSRASNESVEELLRSTSLQNARAYFFRYNRHDFYALTTDDFTLVYDLITGSWSRWDTYGLDNFQAHLGFQIGTKVFSGDISVGKLWQLVEGFADDPDGANTQIVREVSGGVFNTGKPFSCNDVIVRVNAGWDPTYTTNPALEMRFSDDQGATWTSQSQDMGVTGQYMTDVIYRSLGLIHRPGRLFEFRFSDYARVRLDYATLNEADG